MLPLSLEEMYVLSLLLNIFISSRIQKHIYCCIDAEHSGEPKKLTVCQTEPRTEVLLNLIQIDNKQLRQHQPSSPMLQ